ncbi:hypothetical protein CAOG_01427 [Capsaspora owczarzaki ATCC 30864]|uniref:NADH dehydrogenase [ubiquinone] flavoprotein 3, mitochondrial n=1 Tax=Capsaspora owczarzaki (strain ATCC 30864) TaxID=595528 RepID=A0A0D2U4H0_CAPO3|nr:hypothetical protein CAOG_01427 [Capsaspora owczarzaki ATCC 30864]KJE90051.1 hypothetical protein CAOG_001427 [Capsaspora owczarzaki ATCC 30864]|eukprot:XP_004349947.1 hypothetical protein CAOG_01427 [Capsaspora owczarzaki ATCC 30864]
MLVKISTLRAFSSLVSSRAAAAAATTTATATATSKPGYDHARGPFQSSKARDGQSIYSYDNKGDAYQTQLFFQYTPYSYFDVERDVGPHRIPQPVPPKH